LVVVDPAKQVVQAQMHRAVMQEEAQVLILQLFPLVVLVD